MVMKEVETVSHQYVPLASACSAIYFTLESLSQLHYLYQVSELWRMGSSVALVWTFSVMATVTQACEIFPAGPRQ